MTILHEFEDPKDFKEIWSVDRPVGLHQQGGEQGRKTVKLFTIKEVST